MNTLKEFKDFAIKGNVVDMAVGIIIGVAFGKIVSSLVSDVIMPPLGAVIGGVDFSTLSIVIKEANASLPSVAISYGKFIQTIFDFAIIAFSLFMVVRVINKLKKKELNAAEAMPPAPTKQEILLAEIRDLLKKKS